MPASCHIDARAISPHFPGIGRYLRSLIHAMSRSLDRTKPWLSFTTVTFILRAAASIGQSHPLHIASASPSLSQQRQIPKLLKGSGAQVYHSPYYLMPYRAGDPHGPDGL